MSGSNIRIAVHNRFLRRPLLVLEIEERLPYNFDPATDIKPGGYVSCWRVARLEDFSQFIPKATKP